MPSNPVIPSRSYSGVAVPTYVTAFSSGISGLTPFTVSDTSTWLDLTNGTAIGSSGHPFVVAVGVGTANEEKMLVTMSAAGASATLTPIVRGYDTYSGIGYDWQSVSQPVVAPVFSAVEAYEANRAAIATSAIWASNNATPSQIVTGTGSPGTAYSAANADHTHQMPASTIKAVIDTSYIQTAVPSSYLKQSGNIDTAYIQAQQAYPTGGSSTDPVPQAYIRSKQLYPASGTSREGTLSPSLSTTSGTTKVITPNITLTGFTNYMWIAKMSTTAAPSGQLEVFVQLLDNTSAIGTVTTGAFIPATAAGVTIMATGIFTGSAATTYNFNFGCYTSTGTVASNRANLTVVGLS